MKLKKDQPTYNKILQHDKRTRRRHNRNARRVRRTSQKLARQRQCSPITVPKLRRVPVLGKRFHGQFAVEGFFGAPLELLELLLVGIALAVECLERAEGVGGELACWVR